MLRTQRPPVRKRARVMSPSDQELYRGCCDDSLDQSLKLLLDRHWEGCFRTSYAILRDSALAEDCAQNAFIKLSEKAGRKETLDNPATWLRRVVVNESLTKRRAEQRRTTREQKVARDTEQRADGPQFSLEDLVGSLSEKLRVPLELHFGLGLTHSEVSHALSWPVGTVSSRIRLGLERLRESLGSRGAALSTTAIVSLLQETHAAAAPPLPAPPAITALLSPVKVAVGFSMAKSMVAGLIALSLLMVGVLLKPTLFPGENDGQRSKELRRASAREDASGRPGADRDRLRAETGTARLDRDAGSGVPMQGKNSSSVSGIKPDGMGRSAADNKAGSAEARKGAPTSPKHVSVSGYVTDRHGRALPGAWVSIWANKLNLPFAGNPHMALTDGSGYYSIDQVPKRLAQQVKVGKSGYFTQTCSLDRTKAAQHLDFKIERELHLGLSFLNADGRPVIVPQPVYVRVARINGSNSVTRPSVVDKEGRHTFGMRESLLQELVLEVQVPGYLPSNISEVDHLERRGDRLVATVTLRRGAGIAGMVRDQHGQPVAKAKVIIIPFGKPSLLGQTIYSNQRGHYQLTGLKGGEYRVEVTSPGLTSGIQKVRLEDHSSSRLDLALHPGRVLELFFVDADSQPVKGVSAQIHFGMPAGKGGQSNAAGRMTIAGLSLASRIYRVTLWSSVTVVTVETLSRHPKKLQLRVTVEVDQDNPDAQREVDGFKVEFPE